MGVEYHGKGGGEVIGGGGGGIPWKGWGWNTVERVGGK